MEKRKKEGVKKGEEVPPLSEHYVNDAEELEGYGLFKKSKIRVAKLNALNPEPIFGITSMSTST